MAIAMLFSRCKLLVSGRVLPRKTNMTSENQTFEDVFPIEHKRFSNVMLVFRGANRNNHPGLVVGPTFSSGISSLALHAAMVGGCAVIPKGSKVEIRSQSPRSARLG